MEIVLKGYAPEYDEGILADIITFLARTTASPRWMTRARI